MQHPHNTTDLPFTQWVTFSTQEAPVSYAFQQEHRTILYLHILLMVVATLIFSPAALMLRRHRTRPILWITASVLSLLGLVLAARHRSVTKDLYVNAAHRKLGVLLVGFILLNTLYSCLSTWRRQSASRSDFVPIATRDDPEEEVNSARSSETLYRHRNASPGSESPREHASRDKRRERRESLIERFRDCLGPCHAAALLVTIYAQILLGLATYCNLFTNHEIFNGLAHWIKSSVFLLFGVWVSMRYFGYGAGIGHAWNSTPYRARHWATPETIESGLIFTYGACDLFLERLGHADEPISHTDIQHMSIALMFASAGFIGLLIESRAVQRILRRAEQTPEEQDHKGGEEEDGGEQKRPRARTCNVMPSLVVFFTGMLMSQHAQDSLFATNLHAVWGYYYCIAAILRIMTYCMLYTAPPHARPSHPPTELLVAFTLIAGSLVFMLSARDTAQALEYYGIDLMFVVGLSVAGSLSCMAWTLYLMILRAL